MLLHAVEAAALSDAQYITAVLPYYPELGKTNEKEEIGKVSVQVFSPDFFRVLE